jgi:hypothetical protein
MEMVALDVDGASTGAARAVVALKSRLVPPVRLCSAVLSPWDARLYLLLHAYALMCARSAVTSQESGKEAADFLCERMTGGPGRSLGRC